MARLTAIFLCLFGMLLAGAPVQAGWLKDKLKDVVEEVADEAIDEAADEAFEEDGDVVSPDEEEEENYPYPPDEEFEGDTYMGEEEFNLPEDEYFDGYDMYGESGGTANECGGYDSGDDDTGLSIREDLHFTARMKAEDLTGETAEGTMVWYIDGTKMRFDMSSGDATNFSVIALGTKPGDKMYSLYHTDRMYAASTLDDESRGMWVVIRETEPCEGYRNATRIGTETLAGRLAVKWSCKDAEPEGSAPDMNIWRDEKLDVLVAAEDACHRSTLLSLDEGRPDASLFSVPEGYRELKIPTPASKP